MSPRRLFALLNNANLTRDQRIAFYRWMTGRHDINSTNDLTPTELAEITTQLWKWDREGVLPARVTEAVQ